jgi:hypothetical protein
MDVSKLDVGIDRLFELSIATHHGQDWVEEAFCDLDFSGKATPNSHFKGDEKGLGELQVSHKGVVAFPLEGVNNMIKYGAKGTYMFGYSNPQAFLYSISKLRQSRIGSQDRATSSHCGHQLWSLLVGVK